MDLFAPFVTKELNRKNALGALESYEQLVVEALIQVLRMRYAPAHYGFGVRYVPFELPPEVVRRIESLSFVASIDTIPEKCQEAVAWFHETAGEVTQEAVRLHLRAAGPRD